MSGKPTEADRSLLARLQALKQSTVSFEETKLPPSASHPQSVDEPSALAGRAFYADLSSRFKALKGSDSGKKGESPMSGSPRQPGIQDEDSKTVEDLLAELGPEESWTIGKTEENEVEDLLKQAKEALPTSPDASNPAEEHDGGDETRSAQRPWLSDIDLSSFAPEPDSDPEPSTPKPSKESLHRSLNAEADAHIQQIMDEIKHERSQNPVGNEVDNPPPYTDPDPNPDQNRDPPLSLPSPSTHAPKPSPSPSLSPASLAERFSSLSLPSAPTTLPTRPKPSSLHLPPVPSNEVFSDAEIEDWCIICNADATLRCVGCDGDLYCARCWMEGHRGESAGWEERKHRATEFVGKKKGRGRKERRVALGT